MVLNDPYKDGIDFQQLAKQDPQFAAFLKPNGQLDFSDPQAVKQLTKSLLKRDFDLVVELPDDRLCPPVPNRLSYIHWIQNLLESTCLDYSDTYDPERSVFGLDIGTGASCIYPLLGCALRPSWRFVATEIDPTNLASAASNINHNNLSARIHLLKSPFSTSSTTISTSTSTSTLLPFSNLPPQTFGFTMCNPPFYTSPQDLLSSASQKHQPPSSTCTGAPIEMVTPGGEVAFVKRLVKESARAENRHRCRWYTSMLGKFSSVSEVVDAVKGVGVGNWAVTEFVPGQAGKGKEMKEEKKKRGEEKKTATKRWAVGWSFMDLRPSVKVARGACGASLPKHLLPFPAEFEITLGTSSSSSPRHLSLSSPSSFFDHNHESVSSRLYHLLSNIGINLQQTRNTDGQWTALGQVGGNTWSRAARRRREQRQQQQQRRRQQQYEVEEDEEKDERYEESTNENPSSPMVFKLTMAQKPTATVTKTATETEIKKGEELRVYNNSNGNGNSKRLTVRWMRGDDGVLFESFCGMLRREVGG